jgi:hypothetical protein
MSRLRCPALASKRTTGRESVGAALVGHIGIAVDHHALDLHGTADGIQYTRKLCQEAVAGVLYGPAAVFRDLGIN